MHTKARLVGLAAILGATVAMALPPSAALAASNAEQRGSLPATGVAPLVSLSAQTGTIRPAVGWTATVNRGSGGQKSTAKPSAGQTAVVACPFERYGYTGYTPCAPDGFPNYSWIIWDNSNTEYFVIGMDWHIWHIWLGSAGWHLLGGNALQDTSNFTETYVHRDGAIGVNVIGTDSDLWCQDWPWTKPWYNGDKCLNG